MKLLWNAKDGGPESLVWMWGLEIKSLFSILLLKFEEGSREAFHTHAFDSKSILISGALREVIYNDDLNNNTLEIIYTPWKVIDTPKNTFHRVFGISKTNWVITVRGPWDNTWEEFNKNGMQTLTHGRKVVNG